MQIEVQFPSAAEADVSFNAANGKVTVTPRFRRPDAQQSLASVTVKGDRGSERRYGLIVGGSTGDVRTIGIKQSIVSIFDQQEPNTPKTSTTVTKDKDDTDQDV